MSVLFTKRSQSIGPSSLVFARMWENINVHRQEFRCQRNPSEILSLDVLCPFAGSKLFSMRCEWEIRMNRRKQAGGGGKEIKRNKEKNPHGRFVSIRSNAVLSFSNSQKRERRGKKTTRRLFLSPDGHNGSPCSRLSIIFWRVLCVVPFCVSIPVCCSSFPLRELPTLLPTGQRSKCVVRDAVVTDHNIFGVSWPH
jgi:hypothetical protein